MVFYAAANGVAHGKKKPASQKTPASMICTAADAIGHEIDLSWGESRRDMVFYTAASGVAHGKKKPASQKTPASMIFIAAHAVGYEIGLPCTKTMPAPAICTAADAVGYEIGLPCTKTMSWHNVLCGSQWSYAWQKKSRHPKRHQPL